MITFAGGTNRLEVGPLKFEDPELKNLFGLTVSLKFSQFRLHPPFYFYSSLGLLFFTLDCTFKERSKGALSQGRFLITAKDPEDSQFSHTSYSHLSNRWTDGAQLVRSLPALPSSQTNFAALLNSFGSSLSIGYFPILNQSLSLSPPSVSLSLSLSAQPDSLSLPLSLI